MYVLDTDIISYLLKASPPPTLKRAINSVPTDKIFTTSITFGELTYGARKKQSKRLLKQIEQLIRTNFPVLPFDKQAAGLYGEIRAYLEAQGNPIGEPDTRIAAIALAHGSDMVTGNVRHFNKVPNLTVHNWL